LPHFKKGDLTMMKTVIFTNNNCYRSFEYMLRTENVIGFIPASSHPSAIEKLIPSKRKYAVLTYGTYRGLAVDGKNAWTDFEKQKEEKGTYFSFNSRTDLLLWMAGDECVHLQEIYLIENGAEDKVLVGDFDELVNNFRNIGFVPRDYHGTPPKFFILPEGSYKGAAIKADLVNTWTKIEDQKKAKGTYFVFDSKEELMIWLGFYGKE
jgi:hypothetical protein